MRWTYSLGRTLFALGLLGFCLRQVATSQLIRLVPAKPEEIWMPIFWVYFTGVLLTYASFVLLLNRPSARVGAAIATVLFAVIFFGFCVGQIVMNPATGYIWTNPLKTLALLGGGLLLTAYPSAPCVGAGGERTAPRLGQAALLLNWLFLGAFLVICGVQHFVYAGFVDTLVPTWIPSSQRFWTWFTGAALVAGGIGLAIPKTRGLAAFLSGVMIFLWVLLLHLPRALGMHSAFEVDGVSEATAISGVCFLCSAAAHRVC